jgi:uncharacterized protein (DUF362 family)
MDDRKTVVVARDPGATYPLASPFDPHEAYPELPGLKLSATPNRVYALVRDLLLSWGLDRANAGAPSWNPLGDVVRPGDHVLLKPNLVFHGSGAPEETAVLLSNAAVIRPLLDYAIKALEGRGAITIGDAPLQSGDFAKIVEQTQLGALVDSLAPRAGVPLRLLDFRQECVTTSVGGFIGGHVRLQGAESGYHVVDVGSRSAHLPIESDHERFRVTDYVPDLMRRYQGPGRHQYVIPRVVLRADVIINVPKMKTHRKAGLTCALKNLVGINGRKDCLPHHRKGSVKEGGDEFLNSSRLKSLYSWCDELADTVSDGPFRLVIEFGKHVPKVLAKALAADRYFEGSWWGNDTLWRTIHDLNRILYYADRDGRVQAVPARRVMHVVDAIIAGEGEGPMEPTPVACGVLLGGMSPLAVDSVAATIMGLDPGKMPTILHGFDPHPLPIGPARPEDIEILVGGLRVPLAGLRDHVAFRFVPADGWKGHIELEEQEAPMERLAPSAAG